MKLPTEELLASVVLDMPTNPIVKDLTSKGYKTFTGYLKELGFNIRPNEAKHFLATLAGIKIKNRTYYSPEQLLKIKEYYLNLTREEKIKKTKKEKYNNENFSNREKAKKTCLDKYGVDNVSKIEAIQEKKEETCLKHFGERYGLKTEIVKEKMKQTCIERYGVEYASSSKEIQEKRKQTCLKRYGKCFHELVRKNKYFYDNIYFDSSWELAYYFYLKFKNIKFTYHPKTFFEYFDSNSKIRKYFPDFLVEEEFIEIKGDYFFKNGKLINPYTTNLQEEVKAENKFKCMVENNIKILTYKDLKDIIKFSSKALGGLKKFKI